MYELSRKQFVFFFVFVKALPTTADVFLTKKHVLHVFMSKKHALHVYKPAFSFFFPFHSLLTMTARAPSPVTLQAVPKLSMAM